MDQFAAQVGLRIRAAREASRLTQEELTQRLGFNDRQTLAAIETGNRRVSAEELVRFMGALGCDLDYFTDPFRLVGEGRFSFRARGVEEGDVESFGEKAGQWIAFWRDQTRRRQKEPGPLRLRLALGSKSTFEDAQQAAERLVQQWDLGDTPATRLIEAIEGLLDMLVLAVDMPKGLSGAACQVPGADTILINRRESEGRRQFDLAHELFHVLTWDALPPERVDREKPSGYKAKRVEQLADNFAGTLLMPRMVLEPSWKAREVQGVTLQDWIAAMAARLRVSAVALQNRLLALGFIDRGDVYEIDTDALAEPVRELPAFSRRYMERAAEAVERGEVSVMRLIRILGTTGRGGLEDLFLAHGLPVPLGV
jgi:Zn-dependent peptidase ImmA (M78 family)/DNA-binding XRE family transcriptional regulator